MRLFALALFALACHRAPPSTEGPALPAGGEVAVPEVTPAALYQECVARLEGPEVPAECQTAADCTATGCSGEVCTTVKAAQGMMSTCEVLPCFDAVDACGCVDGRCRWSLVAELPVRPKLELPPK